MWPFTVFLIRNFIPFTLLWHLRFKIEFLWEILFFLIRHTYDSKKELRFGGAQMNMKVMMSEYYCDVDFFISICFICFIIYYSLYILIDQDHECYWYRLNFTFYAKRYVQNFAINLSMSGRSNWIDALLHFCFVGHWAWQLFKKQFARCFEIPLQCHKIAVGTPSNKKILKIYIWNDLQKNALNR